MEVLYKLSNGDIYDLRNNRYVNYSSNKVYRHSIDFCFLNNDFSFRFNNGYFEYSIGNIYNKIYYNYRALGHKSATIIRIDNNAFIIYEVKYGLLIERGRPICFVDFFDNKPLAVFDIKSFMLNYYNYYSKIENEISNWKYFYKYLLDK